MRKATRACLAAAAALAAVGAAAGGATAQECPRGSLSESREAQFGIFVDWDWADGGMRVARVKRGWPAEDAGLRAGDIVTSVGGRDLTEPFDEDVECRFSSHWSVTAQRFSAVLNDLPLEEGREFVFEALRDGEAQTFRIAPRNRAATLRDALVRAREVFRRMHIDTTRMRIDTTFAHALSGLDSTFARIAVRFDTLEFDLRRLDDSLTPLRFNLRRLDHSPAPLRSNVWRLDHSPAPLHFNLRGAWDHGLDLVDLNPDLGAYFGAAEGVLVAEADAGSWTGLRGGDVVTHVDGRPVEDAAKFRRILRSYDPGEELRFRIRREGEETTVSANMK